MKILFLPLIVALSIPMVAIAESYYLILSKRGTGLERIEMNDVDECEQLGKQWSEVSGSHTFVCLKAK